jgi:MFS family permease
MTPTPARAAEGVVLGALVMILTQLVMVAIMTMTPVHMHDHGHSTAASGLVIHIGAMYLPSPLTGWLVDRYGRMKIAAASGITLLTAGILAAAAPGDSVALLALALALLGLGWNFGLVSGTAIITDTVPLATRAKTQGLVNVSIAIAGATDCRSQGTSSIPRDLPTRRRSVDRGLTLCPGAPLLRRSSQQRVPCGTAGLRRSR